jgi:ribosomal protein S18 acetylase RimI-like enzyme
VAKDKDRVIGFVGYGQSTEEPEYGEIFALYVLSEYRGMGIGRRLMDAGLEKLKEYPKIHVWLLKENRRAFRFYEKCGFQSDGTEKLSPSVNAVGIRMTLEKE